MNVLALSSIKKNAETFFMNVSAPSFIKKKCRNVHKERFGTIYLKKNAETFFMNVSAPSFIKKKRRNVLKERFGTIY